MQKLICILRSIKENLKLQLHLLGHFEAIGESYKHLIIEKGGAEEEDYTAQLTLSGSVYLPSFAEDPIEMLNNLLFGLEKYPYVKTEKENMRDLLLFFPQEIYPEGIGLDAVISIADLNEKEKAEIIKIRRNENEINAIKGEKKPTWQLNAVFRKDHTGEFNLQTIFPGQFAPPFPNMVNQSKEDYLQAKDFWNNHLLLI